MKRFLTTSLLSFITIFSWCQSTKNWHWKDFEKDSVHGISLQKAYQLLANYHLSPSPIIVAVIDGGIDTNHIDLKKVLWNNPNEIPNNHIDDDHNGYVDDVHGWNFLGGKDGRNIDKADAEKTRIYHQLKQKFIDKIIDTNKLNVAEKKQYATWIEVSKEIEFSNDDVANLQYMKMAAGAIKKIGANIIKEIGDSNFTAKQLDTFQPIGRIGLEAKNSFLRTVTILGIEKETPFTEIVSDLNEYIDGKEKAANAKEFSPSPLRQDIIKDRYDDFSDRYYGNNDITGPNAKHGTHVAGLVASFPDSSWLVSNLYPPIKIMGIRAVPDGDEYDKDIALSIRYAVDNGAKIINMSFGKSYSPEQIWVDSAIRYAASKDVLIIHSAGNEFYNLDQKSVYPNPYSNQLKDSAKNILTVAASSDELIGESLLTDFSNYGPKVVDVLAPGNKIYSTFPGKDNHGLLSGTSMASPIVSNIAALIRAYFPQLSAVQVKSILMKSVWVPSAQTSAYLVPQHDVSKTLLEIAKAGGIVNAAKAIQLAKIVAGETTIKTVKKKRTTN
jgi:subtilisin family serine protease